MSIQARDVHPNRPDQGWDSLTPTEQLVVELLLDGGSNRIIGERLGISRRTVETHLSHVFLKVGIASRVRLAAVAALRSVEAPSNAAVTP
jgi:DNA-binding CsgD family transcriptional regulator